MRTEKKVIQGKEYRLMVDYQEDPALRRRLHPLTQQIFSFDFEEWYQGGFWGNSCHPYTLFAGEQVASHITVSEMEFLLDGERKRYIQLGTVMTNPAYRNQGLSRLLMERVLAEWRERCDLIYLYANDSVLHFYPRFGFIPARETEVWAELTGKAENCAVRQMDIEQEEDRRLLVSLAGSSYPLAKLSMQKNPGLVMFYIDYFKPFSAQVYYLEDYKAAAVAAWEGNTLLLHDVFGEKPVSLMQVSLALSSLRGEQRQAERTEWAEQVIFSFLPAHTEEGMKQRALQEEDSTLFLQGKDAERFQKGDLRFPLLSHT